MKILVLSCDKNKDLFYPFYHCMEKYYKEHDEIIYATETIKNPYYKTINVNIPIEHWTKRILETLKQIDDDKVMLMIDDDFIREKVDIKRLKQAINLVKGNVASVNLEKSFDKDDIYLKNGFYKRNKNGRYKVSLMCSIWSIEALKNVLSVCNCDPWTFEENNNGLNYDYLINGEDLIINWGYIETYKHCNLKLGKWCRETIPFFEKENIKIDYEQRGYYD